MSSQSRHDLDYSTRGTVADITSSFAGVLLLVTGSMDILQGLAAIANDDVYGQNADYIYGFNASAWGWIHLVLGVLSILVAVGILLRKGWGQVTGIIVAGLGMLTNFAALPHYPFWGLIVIAFYALVIWSLTTQMRRYR
jgi:hypothetical protein